MKVQISMDEKLLSRVDEAADETFKTRSGLITDALTEYFMKADMFKAVKQMSLAVRLAAEKGELDAETQRQIEDFQRLAALLAKS